MGFFQIKKKNASEELEECRTPLNWVDVGFQKDFKYQQSRNKLSYHEILKLGTQKYFLSGMCTGQWPAWLKVDMRPTMSFPDQSLL